MCGKIFKQVLKIGLGVGALAIGAPFIGSAIGTFGAAGLGGAAQFGSALGAGSGLFGTAGSLFSIASKASSLLGFLGAGKEKTPTIPTPAMPASEVRASSGAQVQIGTDSTRVSGARQNAPSAGIQGNDVLGNLGRGGLAL